MIESLYYSQRFFCCLISHRVNGGVFMKNRYCLILALYFVSQNAFSMDQQERQIRAFDPKERVESFLKKLPSLSLKDMGSQVAALTETEKIKMLSSLQGPQKDLVEIVSYVTHADTSIGIISSLLDMPRHEAEQYYTDYSFFKVLKARFEMEKYPLNFQIKNGQKLDLNMQYYVQLPDGGARQLARVFKRATIGDCEKAQIEALLQQICDIHNQQRDQSLPIDKTDFSGQLSLFPSRIDRVGSTALGMLTQGSHLYPFVKVAGGFLLAELVMSVKSGQLSYLLPFMLASLESTKKKQDAIRGATFFLRFMGTKAGDIAGVVALFYLVAMAAHIDSLYVDHYKNHNKWRL